MRFSVVFLLAVAFGEVIVGVEGGVGQDEEEDDAVNDVKLLEEEERPAAGVRMISTYAPLRV